MIGKKLRPPANVSDFTPDSRLSEIWHKKLLERFKIEIQFLTEQENVPPEQISFFNPLESPEGQMTVAHITWGGFPNVLTSKYGRPDALQKADQLESFGVYDSNGSEIRFQYRPQDEYLEWTVRRDESTGKIKEVIFTCEGPEYWELLAHDTSLLLKLYQTYADQSVSISDLIHQQDVYLKNENGGLELIYKKGDYNRWNKWNISYAIHLTHLANTLFAEINLASRSTVLRMREKIPITDAHRLICCSGYGSPNRDSDPTIGFAVNSTVRNRNWVSLHDPVGIYIDGIDSSQFAKPNGSAILDFENRYWKIQRASEDGKMILRASVSVPEDEIFEGRPLLLGDLLVNGERLEYGGQIAETITVGLYADIIPNGPRSAEYNCPYKCCTDPAFPNVEEIVPIDQSCKSSDSMQFEPKNDRIFARDHSVTR